MRGLTIGSKVADLYQIGVDIDQAPGAFARTFVATNGDGHERAIKVFRSEHFELPEERCYQYYRTLGNEADLLAELKGHPNVVELYDVGYVWPKQGQEQQFDAYSFGLDVQDFCAAMEIAFSRRYLPYLILQRMPQGHSLFRLVRRNPHNVRLPSEEIIGMALQLATFLVEIHARGILYWDPKPEHFYWDGQHITVIDWNVSRRMQSADGDHKGQDIQLVAQRVLYPVIMGGASYATGATIEATPGSSADPVRREQIDYRWQEKWIDAAVRSWLDPALRGEYQDAESFLRDIRACARHFGWEIPGCPPPSAKAKQARASMSEGLRKLYKAHTLLEEASKHFAQAGIHFLPEEYREATRLSRLVRELLEDGWFLT
ncbi:MAG: hypothetical protein FJZ90_06205 [Chloroflexi bacterium]|nr:hypothetical protein [Chloroflexota bacterium]